MDSRCSIDGCNDPIKVKRTRLCNKHQLRLARHGHPLAGGASTHSTPEGSFNARTEPDGECLIWTGCVGSHGYGSIAVAGKMILAHRYAWERAHGAIPNGLVVDHTCHQRKCVAIAHLRLATPSQNNQNQPGAQRGRPFPRGVYLNKKTGNFYVQVRHNKKTHLGGTYESATEAGRVAEVMRREMFGEYAGSGKLRPDLIDEIAERIKEKP